MPLYAEASGSKVGSGEVKYRSGSISCRSRKVLARCADDEAALVLRDAGHRRDDARYACVMPLRPKDGKCVRGRRRRQSKILEVRLPKDIGAGVEQGPTGNARSE